MRIKTYGATKGNTQNREFFTTMEMLQYLNDNFEHAGFASLIDVHENGDWHEAFHNWIIRPGGKILIQRRSYDNPHNPGALCVSAGGHMQKGETLRNSQRETNEELGLNITFEQATYLGVIHLEAAHEVVHVSFIEDDTPLKDYQLQEDEVGAIYEMGINDGIAFFAGKTDTIELNGYRRTIDGMMAPETFDACHTDFSVDTTRPWLWLLCKAKRYINGHYESERPEVDIKNPLEIF